MIQPFYLPIKILFGPGSIDQLGQEVKVLGRRAMIVTYPDIRKLGFLDIVLKDPKSKGWKPKFLKNWNPIPAVQPLIWRPG